MRKKERSSTSGDDKTQGSKKKRRGEVREQPRKREESKGSFQHLGVLAPPGSSSLGSSSLGDDRIQRGGEGRSEGFSFEGEK